MLVEEVARRSHVSWQLTADAAGDGPRIVIESKPKGGARDGYAILTRGQSVTVSGNDARGLFSGVGRLLRELRIERTRVLLPGDFSEAGAPQTPLRGHQLGYRNLPNSYDGWDVAAWERYMRDLVIFGANAIELIPPGGDGTRGSPHFPLPEMDMMVEMSRIAASYGLEVWIWWPALDGDYSRPEIVDQAMVRWADIVRRLPRVDAIFVPGGDPGRTRPNVLLPFLEKQAANLRKVRPGVQMWVSPQSFSGEWMDEFLAQVARQPEWLTGIVYGPEVRMSIAELRGKIPARYPIRSYPDITHTSHAQYVQPNWDIAYALTQNREPINPRPEDMRAIFTLEHPHSMGFLTYSEGCNDDVNKVLWSAWGWNPKTDALDILRQYARYFIAPEFEDSFAQGLLALERNWRGPLLTNAGVDTTLAQFQQMERSARPAVKANWRFQMALYRAYYDAYQRRRLIHDTEAESEAAGLLRRAGQTGVAAAIRAATVVLDARRRKDPAPDLRERIFALGEGLFQNIRMQLSVERYGAQARERGATLDNIDTPLNNDRWLKARFDEIAAMSNEPARLAALDRIVNWTNPGPGGFYDDLGDPANSPHLVRPAVYADDPGHLRSPLVGYARRYWLLEEPWRISSLSNAESMFDAPVEMRYAGLDPDASYRVRIVYGGEEGSARVMKLTANGNTEIHVFRRIERLSTPVEFDVPQEATHTGELRLTWIKQPGLPGAGRGCQIAEVWLIRRR